MVSGWSALQTQATYGQLRDNVLIGRRRSAIGWATVCLDRGRDARSGFVNLTGAYLLQRADQDAAIEKLAGGQP